MEYDEDKVDEMVLALLSLTMFREGPGFRAWKGHDWDALDRLHEKGYISDPRSKAKSVVRCLGPLACDPKPVCRRPGGLLRLAGGTWS